MMEPTLIAANKKISFKEITVKVIQKKYSVVPFSLLGGFFSEIWLYFDSL